MSKLRWTAIWIMMGFLGALPCWASTVGAGIEDLVVRSSQMSGRIVLPGGIEGEFMLLFEEASGLNSESLAISARLVDPEDPQWAERLPRDVFIADKFPVVLHIEADATSELSYRGRWSLEMRTANLEFSPYSPLRLFRAPTGGNFEDITETMGFGSYRVRGIGADFSEFVIGADLRMVEEVIANKFNELTALLSASAHRVSASIQTELEERVKRIYQDFESGDLDSAFANLDQLVRFIRANSGSEIPDLSSPRDRLVGLAPRLRAAATSLRFSLDLVALPTAVGGGTGLSKVLSLDDGTSVEVQLTFSEAFDIDFNRLSLTAERIDVQDPALVQRLPRGVRVPAEFPMLIRLKTDPDLAQAFSGHWSLDLHTEALEFYAETPLRLFKAPDGGRFNDITETIGLGSYRVRGIGADFSEFLVVEDLRSASDIVNQKLGLLEGVFAAHADKIETTVRQELRDHFDRLARQIADGRYQRAIDTIDELRELIQQHRGYAIPAIWRSQSGHINVAGLLASSVKTLRFSLELAATPKRGDPADVNRNGTVDAVDVFHLIERVFGGS